MENLQILKGVKNLKCGEEVVKRIPNIKKLGLEYSWSIRGMIYDDYYCLGNIKSLSKLESLYICSNNFEGNSLQKLTFPHSLKCLSLSMALDFEWEETLEKICPLPNLEKLKLLGGCFGTGKWEVVEDQFPSLKYLSLFMCRGLKEWRAATEGSSIFPCLEKLKLFGLIALKKIPSEIPTQQRIELNLCSDSAVMSAKEIVEEQVELQGDQLPFHVKALLVPKTDEIKKKLAGAGWDHLENNEALLSLAGPKFEVSSL